MPVNSPVCSRRLAASLGLVWLERQDVARTHLAPLLHVTRVAEVQIVIQRNREYPAATLQPLVKPTEIRELLRDQTPHPPK